MVYGETSVVTCRDERYEHIKANTVCAEISFPEH